MSLSCSAEAIKPQKCLLIALIKQLRKIYTAYYFLQMSSIATLRVKIFPPSVYLAKWQHALFAPKEPLAKRRLSLRGA